MPQRIVPNLWFDTQSAEAAEFYTSVFPNSRVTRVTHYPESAGKAGEVLTVEFELDGDRVLALNGGPEFKFNEAVSLQVDCKDQAEVDYYWERLGEGGEHGPCGWLKDRYGLSWQITPADMEALFNDPDPKRADRAFAAMMTMGKLDIAALEAAANAS